MPEYRFNEEEADRAQAFFERVLVHTKSIYARRPFILTPWQRDEIVRPLFGWQRYDEQYHLWVRKYSRLYVEVGRGNGKSELVAGLTLLMLVADGEESAEVYGAAEDRDQGDAVYLVAKRMVEFSPYLSRILEVVSSRKRIVHHPTASFYQVLPRDEMGHGSQGLNVHFAGVDEYHVHKSPKLLQALKKGMGKRVQPLTAIITTAGNDPASACAEEHEYAVKVLAGEVEDPSLLAFVRNTPKDADPFDEANWYHANPGLGDFLSLETLRQEAREAKAKPSEENDFRQFRLNQWVQQRFRWMPLHRWDETAGLVDEAALQGRDCFGGLDLATSIDIAALCWDFPDGSGGDEAIWRFWIPRAQMADLNRRTAGKADVWEREGFLQVTEGDVIDYDAIWHQVDADARAFHVVEVAYDPWGMTEGSQGLAKAGLTVVPFRQGYQSMSPAIKELERRVYLGTYRHGGNPVMRWMIDNVVATKDPAGNLKFDKAKSGDRIDGAVAAVMANDRACRHVPKRRYGGASF